MGRMQWIVGGVILAVGIPLLAQAPAPQPAMKVMVRPITGPVKTPPKAVPNPVPLYVKVDPASLTVDQQKAILKVHAETKAALNKLLADEHSKVVALLNAKQKAALDQQDLKDNLDSMSEVWRLFMPGGVVCWPV